MKLRCRLSSWPPVQFLHRLQFSLSRPVNFSFTVYNFPSPHRHLLSFPSFSSSCLRQFLHRPPSTRPELHLIFFSSLGFLLLSIILASCSFGSSPLQEISSSHCFRVRLQVKKGRVPPCFAKKLVKSYRLGGCFQKERQQ